MAGLAAVALISVGAAGIEKIKAHRDKRKARRASIADAEAEHEARENRFASSKAREASEERRRRIDEEETDALERERQGGAGPSRRTLEPNELGTHPALRRGRPVEPEVEAPPPYVKDAPSYEEHYAHAIPGEPETLQPPPKEPKALSRKERRRQQQDEYREFGALIRDGQQINMAGVPIAQTNQPRQPSPLRAGETEEQRRKRKRAEFFSLRRGSFYILMGAGLSA